MWVGAVNKVLILLVALVLLPTFASAQQKLFSDPEVTEKSHFQKTCGKVEFGPGFVKRFDINNDGITDVVTDHSDLTCDGVRGPKCNADGCPQNFYVQAKEGGYIMIATAQIYGYDFVQYFGNMVFMLQMHPRFCERTDAAPCVMRVRVRGGRFVTISKQ
ncbi:hypothetical protein ASG19_06245 [Rhizobium sp. Leaf306]|nr:hypothetical protein ASG19_06245 [Rhizobium sp. Leaf306]KQQ74362.1 hypothetical protein ASF70_05435 [Rhizobium sp. Leaf321]